MDFQLKDRFFVVCGATSGFGKAIAELLIQEGARVLAIARGEEGLTGLKEQYPRQVSCLAGDLTLESTLDQVVESIGNLVLDGLLLNAAGPPVKSVKDTTLDDWDQAYHSLVRWKISLVKRLLPRFEQQQYGRILFIESVSVKQPVENLVLSTSMRLAVTGFSKTLSQELSHTGISVNVMAPGYHDTPALERILNNLSAKQQITVTEARKKIEAMIPVGQLGKASDFAVMATWLLSPRSGFVTGQVIPIDGGVVKSTL